MSGLVEWEDDTAGTVPSISLSSARGETVDTQVVVQGSVWGSDERERDASACRARRRNDPGIDVTVIARTTTSP